MMTRADWLCLGITGLAITGIIACFAAGRGWI